MSTNRERRALKRWERSPPNRLKSIVADAARVDQLLRPHRELIHCFANMRCGEWYLPPQSTLRGGCGLPLAALTKALSVEGATDSAPEGDKQPSRAVGRVAGGTSCYFKSADMHFGQWSFSAVRLNLHLLAPYLQPAPQAGPSVPGGPMPMQTVIVDATQQGKRFPDALSKTVPVWCAVVNEALYYGPATTMAGDPDDGADHDRCFSRLRVLLPSWVSDSEVSAIADRLPAFVATFAAQWALHDDLRGRVLRAPLSVRHVSAEDDEAAALLAAAMQAPVTFVLLCASGDTQKVRPRGGWSYVTGAGDDHDTWGAGLCPRVFWGAAPEILLDDSGRACAPDAIISDRIAALVQQHALSGGAPPPLVAPHTTSTAPAASVSRRILLVEGLSICVGDGGCASVGVHGSPCIRVRAMTPAESKASGAEFHLCAMPQGLRSGAVLSVLAGGRFGLQRCAFALLVVWAALRQQERGASVALVTTEADLALAVACACVILVPTTSPSAHGACAAFPVPAIEGGNTGSQDDAEEVEGQHEPIAKLLAAAQGSVSRVLCPRSSSAEPIDKAWVRACHQRVSTACGGVVAQRSLMQQINQYFLTPDDVTQNTY